MNPSVAVQRSTFNAQLEGYIDKHFDGETEFKIEYFVVLKIDLLHKFTVTDVGVECSLSSSLIDLIVQNVHTSASL